MKGPNYDDPKVEKRWVNSRRKDVELYLTSQRVKRGRIGSWPAWHVAPYVSVWAIESATRPEWVGWWVICGDLPTDYVSAKTIKHPREAVRAFAKRWLSFAADLKKGQITTNIHVEAPEEAKELAPLLNSRAKILAKWASDESLWPE
jgi:hypothetical protein